MKKIPKLEPFPYNQEKKKRKQQKIKDFLGDYELPTNVQPINQLKLPL